MIFTLKRDQIAEVGRLEILQTHMQKSASQRGLNLWIFWLLLLLLSQKWNETHPFSPARLPLAPDVDLQSFANAAEGFSGADLASLAREAAMLAIRRAAASTNEAQDCWKELSEPCLFIYSLYVFN